MTTEGQYYTEKRHRPPLSEHTAEGFCQKQLRLFYERYYTYKQISADYTTACSVQPAPIKMAVSRQLYAQITKMPMFVERTNHLHFLRPDQLTEDYKPQLDETNQSVYVQIDPSYKENEYTFQ